MAQLTANIANQFETVEIQNLPVAAGVVIYSGSAVGDNGSGYMQQLVAGNNFRGFAIGQVNNVANTSLPSIGVPATSGAAGALTVAVRTIGYIYITVASAAVTDVGRAVYASDGATFTYTQSTNSLIGKVIRFVNSTTVVVSFDATSAPVLLGATITDSTGGTPSTTFAAIAAGASYAQADIIAIKNALAEIALVINTPAKHN